MNSKWYIGTLLILIALIGLSQGQSKVANQQIVLQFSDVEMNSVTAHDDALATVTKKLQALGIVNIQIIENDDARLSIRYYSDVDALSVGEFLSKDCGVSLTYNGIDELPVDFPKDNLPETCSIVVSDLQQQTDGGLSSNGKFAFEPNQDYHRFTNPVVVQFANTIVFEQDAVVQVAFKMNRVIAIAIDKTSHTIPEVRAGPYVYGNS